MIEEDFEEIKKDSYNAGYVAGCRKFSDAFFKLLAFVKDIENYTFMSDLELPAKEYYGQSIYTAAKELLNEIGESE